MGLIFLQVSTCIENLHSHFTWRSHGCLFLKYNEWISSNKGYCLQVAILEIRRGGNFDFFVNLWDVAHLFHSDREIQIPSSSSSICYYLQVMGSSCQCCIMNLNSSQWVAIREVCRQRRPIRKSYIKSIVFILGNKIQWKPIRPWLIEMKGQGLDCTHVQCKKPFSMTGCQSE